MVSFEVEELGLALLIVLAVTRRAARPGRSRCPGPGVRRCRVCGRRVRGCCRGGIHSTVPSPRTSSGVPDPFTGGCGLVDETGLDGGQGQHACVQPARPRRARVGSPAVQALDGIQPLARGQHIALREGLVAQRARAGSDRHEAQRGVQPMEIVGVAGRHGLPGSTCAQHHVRSDYVRSAGCCEDAPDAGGVHAA